MAEFSKGDAVRVVKTTFRWTVDGRRPRVGETATIRHVLKGAGILYVAARVAADGTREWLCEFAPGDLELVKPNQLKSTPLRLDAGPSVSSDPHQISSVEAARYYVLAKKQNDQWVFLCGDDPQSTTTAFTIDFAKQFDSPSDALAFRARMERHWKNEFIVYEFDGALLHSLDV
jgi:hypothetical protein